MPIHPALVELVKQCLHNNPRQRPSTDDLLTRLQGMRAAVEGGYGGTFKLDMVRIKLAKEVEEKNITIEELTQQQVSMTFYQGVRHTQNSVPISKCQAMKS